MRYGLLSDVHANLPALRAAVTRLRGEGVDGWLCAGDVVGYGPQPDECVAELADLEPVCVAGNHELVALGELTGDRCSFRARASLRWTRDVLRPDTREWLAGLPRFAAVPGVVVAHGSLVDPEEYVRTPDAAAAQLDRLAREHPEARTLVLGHTHTARVHAADGRVLGPDPDGAVPFGADPGGGVCPGAGARERWLVNPGSVGQSRAREPRPRARFALLELSPAAGPVRARFFAEEYDHHAARDALRARGLPTDSLHVRPGRLAATRRRLRRLPAYLAHRPR